VSDKASGDSADQVDELVAAIGPQLDAPAISRHDVVVVTGPWMAGVTGVVTALGERLPQHKFVESMDLRPGEAPMAVVSGGREAGRPSRSAAARRPAIRPTAALST